MGYRKYSGGDRNFFKFDREHRELEGKWNGTSSGKYGLNGRIVASNGTEYHFSLTAALKDTANFPLGVQVKLVYKGKKVSKAGTPFKDFEIFVDEDVQIAPPEDVKQQTGGDFSSSPPIDDDFVEFEATDDDVPF